MRNAFARPEFIQCFNLLGLPNNFSKKQLWRKAQGNAVQWFKFCQTRGLTAPETARSLGLRMPIDSYKKPAFQVALTIVTAYERMSRFGKGDKS